MFQRKAYSKLQQWKSQSDGETAILIEGARRVGKTTLVKEFANNEYDSHIYIDFSNADKDVTDAFLNHRADLDTLFRILQLYFEVNLTPRKSALIFDEVQSFPAARELIKHLVADGRYDYLETGSLISIKKSTKDIVIPSEEERLTLYPLDFEEYLWATKNRALAGAIAEAFLNMAPLPDAIHRKANRLFDEYVLVGGMPQAVSAFIEDKDFVRCDKIKRRILALYKDDMEKLGGVDGRRAYSIFREIPGQLSSGNKRFKFSSVKSSARFANYESALRWLEDAHLINLCRKSTDPNVGLAMTQDSRAFKCYLGDTGLLVSLGFADGPFSDEVYKAIQLGRVSVNKGMLIENVVAQQLASNGHALFYYEWKQYGSSNSKVSEIKKPSSQRREIDFLLARPYANANNKPRISPIEVKSGRSYSLVSLEDFVKHFAGRVGQSYVLHPKQLVVDGDTIKCPLYMAHCF